MGLVCSDRSDPSLSSSMGSPRLAGAEFPQHSANTRGCHLIICVRGQVPSFPCAPRPSVLTSALELARVCKPCPVSCLFALLLEHHGAVTPCVMMLEPHTQ